MSHESFPTPKPLYLFAVGLLATFFFLQLLWPTEPRRYVAVSTAQARVGSEAITKQLAEDAQQYLMSQSVLARVAKEVRLSADIDLRGRLKVDIEPVSSNHFGLRIESNDLDSGRTVALANSLASTAIVM